VFHTVHSECEGRLNDLVKLYETEKKKLETARAAALSAQEAAKIQHHDELEVFLR
jgi:hypothetical protein